MSKQAEQRENYPTFVPISTRWADNDIYGHVNNVTYYSYFDTAANHYLIHEGGLDIEKGPVIGFVVNSGCNYHSAIAYPDKLEVGLRVDRIGNSSVQYGLAVFKEGQDKACADGHFVHVFVDRNSQKPVSIPEHLRSALNAILLPSN
jgi:acyl-CoA thioester hydrolase